jgi:LPS export ABC transporter protein LptC
MNKNYPYLKIVFFISIGVIFMSCSKAKPINNKIISKDDLPTLSVENIVRNFTQEGKMKGKMQAPLLQKFDGIVEPYYDFPKGISILLFKEDKIEMSARANRAIYYETKKTWEAIGDVVVSNINGDVLQTQKLYGNYKENKIFTDKFVKITKADGTIIKGEKGFESNSEFTIYQFKDVSGKITFSEEFSTTSDSLSVVN